MRFSLYNQVDGAATCSSVGGLCAAALKPVRVAFHSGGKCFISGASIEKPLFRSMSFSQAPRIVNLFAAVKLAWWVELKAHETG
jgi:hypothetical protein